MNKFMSSIIIGFFFWSMLAAVQAHADSGAQLLIRGDQSISLLSEVPIPVNSSHEIFSVKPRLTPRDEIISILGNAELFITPPDILVGSDSEKTNSKRDVQTGESQ